MSLYGCRIELHDIFWFPQFTFTHVIGVHLKVNDLAFIIIDYIEFGHFQWFFLQLNYNSTCYYFIDDKLLFDSFLVELNFFLWENSSLKFVMTKDALKSY